MLRVAEPVDQLAVLRILEEVVEQALRSARDTARADEADDRQRDHDRQVEDALVDPRSRELLVELVGEQHPERRPDEREDARASRGCARTPARTAGRSSRSGGSSSSRSSGSCRRPPIPSQFVNESRIEQIVGNQTRPPVTRTGIPTMTASATRSARGEPDGALPVARAVRPRRSLRCRSPSRRWLQPHDPKIAFFCFWMLLHEPVDVARVVEERLERRDHHRGGEVGPRVAVHVLRDVLGRRDQRRLLLLQRACSATVFACLLTAEVARVRSGGRC